MLAWLVRIPTDRQYMELVYIYIKKILGALFFIPQFGDQFSVMKIYYYFIPGYRVQGTEEVCVQVCVCLFLLSLSLCHVCGVCGVCIWCVYGDTPVYDFVCQRNIIIFPPKKWLSFSFFKIKLKIRVVHCRGFDFIFLGTMILRFLFVDF